MREFIEKELTRIASEVKNRSGVDISGVFHNSFSLIDMLFNRAIALNVAAKDAALIGK